MLEDNIHQPTNLTTQNNSQVFMGVCHKCMSVLSEHMEIENTAIWPWSKEKLVYKTKVVGDMVTQTRVRHWDDCDSSHSRGEGLAAATVLSKHLPAKRLQGEPSLVIVASRCRGGLLHLVLMDHEHSLMLGVANQGCSAVLKHKLKESSGDIVGCSLLVRKHHWVWREPRYSHGTIACGTMLIQEFQWRARPWKQEPDANCCCVLLETEQINQVLEHGLVVFNVRRWAQQDHGYHPMTMQSILNGFFLTDPETRQLWLIAVGRAQLSGRQKGLQDDCPCLCVGNGDYQPCILYQFSIQKFEEEMESNFDSTEFPQITSYKDLTGEQKLLCARSWYLLHFFPDTNGSLCSTLENVLESCYYDFQLD